MKNYYEILQVDKNADEEIIKKVFKYHIKKNHPDLFQGEEKQIAKEKVQEFNEAYEILSDKNKRKEYDDELNQNQIEKRQESNESIQRLKFENESLRQELVLKEEKIKNIFEELGINYLQYENNYYNVNQGFNDDLKNVENNINNTTSSNVSRRYYEYMKEFLLKIIGMIIFIIAVLLFFSVFLDYNAFQIIIDILSKK